MDNKVIEFYEAKHMEDKCLFKWSNNDIEINIGRNKLIDIDGIQNDEIHDFILMNCDCYRYSTIVKHLDEYIAENYCGLDFYMPVTAYGTTYKNAYEMLYETDSTFHELSEILTEMSTPQLVLQLNEKSQDYYKFIFDNFEILKDEEIL